MEIKNGRAYINGKTIAKAPLKDLLSLSALDIARLNKAQSRQLEKRYYKAAQGRLDTIYKKGLTSYAAERYLGDERPTLSTGASTIYSVKHKVTILKEFLNAKSSTSAGIRKIWSTETARISHLAGNKIEFDSEEERKRFWSAYQEFMHQNPRFADESERVQRFLGRATFWKEKSFTAQDLLNLVDALDGKKGVDIRADAGIDLDI